MAIRLALLDHPYRHGWDWTDDLLPAAAGRLDAWRGTGPGKGALDEVRAALDDDLDLPRAVAAIDHAAEHGTGVSGAAALLGVPLDGSLA